MKPPQKQRTLAMMTGFERYTKKTRRAQFLEEMEQVVPWAKLCALIEPHYPKAGNGRHPVGLERMLRIYFLQQWFNLADPAVEEALYDSTVMRQFAGIDLGREPVPDETTVCKFRHLLEEHGLGGEMLETVNLHWQSKGVRITTGTIVDATIIHAPSSTKNRDQQRDPEMHPTKKGNQWYFGMKAHVGVDSKMKIIHSVVATAAHVADSAVLPELLHGEETRVWGDGAYQGQTEVIRQCAPRACDCTQRRCRYQDHVNEVERAKNRTKSKVRSRVEHVFGVLKLKFGFVKVRYRGLKKNANRLFATCALVNLFVSRKKLLYPATA
jgi:IS5 family transposase